MQRLKNLLPAWAEPYWRLGRYDKPIGTMLFYLPGTWGIALASQTWYPDPIRMVQLYAFSAMVRAAGCTVNDWWDRDLDRKVDRCKSRPIAAGEISTSQAAVFFALNAFPISCAYFMGPPAVRQVIHWFVPMMVAYPLFKRITYWPQVALGFTFNIGLLGMYTYMTNSLHPAPLCFYLGGTCWTLVYDSIYAYQDRNDDVTAGVKSTALRWGENYKAWASLFTAATGAFWYAGGVYAGLGTPYYYGLAATLGHIAWQYLTVDVNSRESCWKKFEANQIAGLMLLAAILAGKLTSKSFSSPLHT